MTSLVQAGISDFAFSVALPAPATAGNLLVAIAERKDGGAGGGSPDTPTGWATIGSRRWAHPAFGGNANFVYKVAAGGEQTVTFFNFQGALIVAELAGALGSQLIAAATTGTSGQSGDVSFATTAAGRPSLVVAGVCTRLRSTLGGDLTAGTGWNRIPVAGRLPTNDVESDSPAILWRDDLAGAGVTVNATQSGTTKDGYCWGIQVAAFALPDASFPPRFW